MIPVPTNKNEIVDLAKELIEQCRVSVGPRSNYYRLMSILAETGPPRRRGITRMDVPRGRG